MADNSPPVPAPALDYGAVDTEPRSFKPWLWAFLLLVASAIVAPLIYFRADMEMCSLPWAHASGGSRPWDMYTGCANCNYPPVLLYMITLAERVRMMLHGEPNGRLMVALVKWGAIASDVAGVLICYYGLQKPFGRRASLAAAGAFALAVPLWFNSAVWGQFDVVLGVAILLAVVAALHQKPGWVGIAAGYAITIKLQAIMPAPAIAVYVFRRMGLKGIGKAVAGAVVMIALLMGPFVAEGQTKKLIAAYTTGVLDLFPRRSMTACNTWFLIDGFDIHVRHIPEKIARADGRKAIGPVTFKQLGELMTLADFVLVGIFFFRRPLDRLLPLAAAMGVFGFFMLCTQMHGRYIIPGVGLLATLWAVAPRTRVIFIGLVVTSTMNEVITLLRDNFRYSGGLPHGVDLFTAGLLALIAVANVVLFIIAHVIYIREATTGNDVVPSPV